MNMAKVFQECTPLLFDGLWLTLQVTVISLLFAMIIGMISCLLGISSISPLRWVSKFYIWLVRGTPLIVQAFYIYFAVPQVIQLIGKTTGIGALSGFRLGVVPAAYIILSLNAGAYMSEIFRGAILAVNTGQMEAARSLGLSKAQAMIKVVLPQAFKICLPSLVNQFIITLKDTSLLSVIGLGEIMYQAKIYQGRTMESFATYTLVALFYLIIVSILTAILHAIERRLS